MLLPLIYLGWLNWSDIFFRTGINISNGFFSNSPLGCVSLCADIWSKGEEQQYGGDVHICVQCAGWQCSRNCRFDYWWAGFPFPLVKVLLTPPIWPDLVYMLFSHQLKPHLHLTQMMCCSLLSLWTAISCFLKYLFVQWKAL